MIKAIVFDFGRVIGFPPEPAVMEALAAGFEQKTFEDLIWKYRDAYDRGSLSGKAYFRQVLTAAGVQADDARMSDENLERLARLDLQGWTRMDPGTVRLMEDTKKAGYTLGILSNIPRDFLTLARASIPVFKLPDVGIFSCEHDSIKPEELIYQKLLSALGCAPGDVVFFDDVAVNVEKARDLGIRAYIWKDPEEARKTLAELGVSLNGFD
jgi:putative hydrolase of the HAD superfamily